MNMTSSEQLLAEALGLYSLNQPQTELIHHNENMTYKITDVDNNYVLRIHKCIEGFSADIYNMNYEGIELVQSELDIISALKNGTGSEQWRALALLGHSQGGFAVCSSLNFEQAENVHAVISVAGLNAAGDIVESAAKQQIGGLYFFF